MSNASGLERFVIWVDLVGGYLVCPSAEVKLGQAVPGSLSDVPLVADVSRHHLTIRRDCEGYVVEALREASLNGRPLNGPMPLADADRLTLGPVALRFSRSHPLSATARLEFASVHRTRPSCEAVLLMADSCVLGPRPNSHVVCAGWPAEVVLFRHGGGLMCQSPGRLTIDDHEFRDRGPLGPGSRVTIAGRSFWLEKLR